MSVPKDGMTINDALQFKKWHIDRYGGVYGVHRHISNVLDWDHDLESAAWLYCNEFPSIYKYCREYILFRLWYGCSVTYNISEFSKFIHDRLSEIQCISSNSMVGSLISDAQSTLLSYHRSGKLDQAFENTHRLLQLGQNLGKFANNHTLDAELVDRGIVITLKSFGHDWSDVIYYFVNIAQSHFEIDHVSVKLHPNLEQGDDYALCRTSLTSFFEDEQVHRRAIADSAHVAEYNSIEPVYPIIYKP